jgi:multidrug transporter EmrE-like cation transporter
MASSLPIGIALALLAGLMSGNCMLPLKFNRRWKYENTWLVFSVVSLVLLPWALALGLVDHIFETYRSLSLWQIAVPFLLGIGWGIAQVLFGISVLRLGLGLAYAIIVGLGAVLGTLVPLFFQHRSQVGETALIEILAGVAVMIAGIALSTRGGQIRERHTIDGQIEGRGPKTDSSTPTSNRYLGAVLLDLMWRHGAHAQFFLRLRPGHRTSGSTTRQHSTTRGLCGLASWIGGRIPTQHRL